MADYIYDGDGKAQGFRLGYFLYRLDGQAVGRVSAERVYALSGEYVGESFKGMVVEKPVGVRGRLPPVATAPNVPPPPSDIGRVPTKPHFPDVFHRLSGEDCDAVGAG